MVDCPLIGTVLMPLATVVIGIPVIEAAGNAVAKLMAEVGALLDAAVPLPFPSAR